MVLERALEIQPARKNGAGRGKHMILIHLTGASPSISQAFLLLPLGEQRVWVINA